VSSAAYGMCIISLARSQSVWLGSEAKERPAQNLIVPIREHQQRLNPTGELQNEFIYIDDLFENNRTRPLIYFDRSRATRRDKTVVWVECSA
jgi:hypothetical protein